MKCSSVIRGFLGGGRRFYGDVVGFWVLGCKFCLCVGRIEGGGGFFLRSFCFEGVFIGCYR